MSLYKDWSSSNEALHPRHRSSIVHQRARRLVPYSHMLWSSEATTSKSRFSTKSDLSRATLLVCSSVDDICNNEVQGGRDWLNIPRISQPVTAHRKFNQAQEQKAAVFALGSILAAHIGHQIVVQDTRTPHNVQERTWEWVSGVWVWVSGGMGVGVGMGKGIGGMVVGVGIGGMSVGVGMGLGWVWVWRVWVCVSGHGWGWMHGCGDG